MKLAISSHDGKFDTPFSDRFGRCRQFVFIETETGNWQTKLNPAAVTRGGAGAQVVQFLADNGVEATDLPDPIYTNCREDCTVSSD